MTCSLFMGWIYTWKYGVLGALHMSGGTGSRLEWAGLMGGWKKVVTVNVDASITLAWRKAEKWDSRWRGCGVQEVFSVSMEYMFSCWWEWSRKAEREKWIVWERLGVGRWGGVQVATSNWLSIRQGLVQILQLESGGRRERLRWVMQNIFFLIIKPQFKPLL